MGTKGPGVIVGVEREGGVTAINGDMGVDCEVGETTETETVITHLKPITTEDLIDKKKEV